MTALTVTLEASQELFVDEQVQSGAYPDADAVIRAAIDRLRAEREADTRKEARYRSLIGAAMASVKRGDVERVDDPRAWLDGLGRRPASG